ncbi:MAG TPA: UDP-3-O-(3-hydroxymyristoyl)glucosamine N-acyltransferase [Roseococcus sp.]|nr:UDP-3-O-(3-hydroxymyristoyl)glucosamine N-acyltransferase [Roseococcus sp.]
MAADPRFFAHAGPQSLAAILAASGGTSDGDPARAFAGVARLQDARPDEVTFLDGRRHLDALRKGSAGAVVTTPALAGHLPGGCLVILSPSPGLAFARIANLFHGSSMSRPGIHATAQVAADARLGANVEIGPYAVIGAGAEIGDFCRLDAHAVVGPGVVLGARSRLHAHASISHAICGERVVLHPGARVGQEGFGFAPTPEGDYVTMPQLGRVLLGDAVEIGANACVDRGSLGDTVLGPGTRVDNLAQVAHNVQTGRGCILVAQVGISGSTTLGDYVQVGGHVGIAGHLSIGSQARIAAMAGVMRDVPPGVEMMGIPALPAKEAFRGFAAVRRLAAQTRGGKGEGG